ncbi:hypothetical protein HUT18_32200 [Streptomyces sp. NA04227]|uniref:hypothetical protein n=1 Tax=Streptomyces sp. NA04227 TaxID=2742136 RepID=UPI0015920F12|nr:hypothetical protein [Streptomyces sp. NA04227]QKW10383.1 hypothetical protein HUT18_32200 [Streptomyces sp. NA04227]
MKAQSSARFTDDNAPIYAELIRDLGDVPEDVRRTAEQVLRKADRAVDFSRAVAA